MRLGMSSAVWYGRYETEDAAVHLRDFSLETCEIFLQCGSEYTASFGNEVRARLGDLPCASVHPKGTNFEGDLFSLSPRQTEDAFRIFENVCVAGQAIGARYYVMHGPSGANTRRTPSQIHDAAARLERLRTVAAAHGIEVLWENVSWCALRSPEDVAEALRLAPSLGFVLDVKQARRAGTDELTMARAMGPHLKHLHVLDTREDGTLCLPGEGIVDFPALFHTAREEGFDGAVILEPYAAQARDEDALRRSLSLLQQLIAI